jgi:hypothetical protein
MNTKTFMMTADEIHDIERSLTSMDMNKFERALRGAERQLERIQTKLGTEEDWVRNRAREGISAARAELAKMRAAIWWSDDALPF